MLQILPRGVSRAHCPKVGLRKPGGAGWGGVSVVRPPPKRSQPGEGKACYSGGPLVVGEGLGLAGVRQTDGERRDRENTTWNPIGSSE